MRLEQKDQWARNAEHRGEVARCQASPRQPISTNTLRMMGRRYVASQQRATGLADPFGMRDARTGMEDRRMRDSAP